MPDLIDDFRNAMARLPAGVSAVSLRQGSLDLAMTATSVVSVSLRPPMVLFTVYADARLREALDEGDLWAISVLSAGAEASAERMAEPGRPARGQLVGIEHHRGALSGAALIEPARVHLECRTSWIRQAGDHDVVVGEVQAVHPGTASAAPALVHHLARLRPHQ